MKRIIMAVLAVAMTALCVQAIELNAPAGRNKKSLELIQGHIPNPAYLRNDSKTGTKVFKNISTTSFATIHVVCTDGAGATKPCRAFPNGGTAYISIPNGERTILLNAGTTSMKFGNISSSTSSTTMFNSERM